MGTEICTDTRTDTEGRCSVCGWPETQPVETVSWHYTSEGVIIYARCACGRLQVRRGSSVVLRAGQPCPG